MERFNPETKPQVESTVPAMLPDLPLGIKGRRRSLCDSSSRLSSIPKLHIFLTMKFGMSMLASSVIRTYPWSYFSTLLPPKPSDAEKTDKLRIRGQWGSPLPDLTAEQVSRPPQGKLTAIVRRDWRSQRVFRGGHVGFAIGPAAEEEGAGGQT
jgi:hypothetical protein